MVPGSPQLAEAKGRHAAGTDRGLPDAFTLTHGCIHKDWFKRLAPVQRWVQSLSILSSEGIRAMVKTPCVIKAWQSFHTDSI